MMLLKALYTPDVVTCGPATTALAAARLMRERHTGDLVVIEEPSGDRSPLGIVTDRDIVVEVLAKDLDPAMTPVTAFMRRPLVLAEESEDAAQALERMRQHGIRRIPVVDPGRRLVGIVTLDDLLHQLAGAAGALADIIAAEQNREHRQRR
jgi:CBS domain-containing protein